MRSFPTFSLGISFTGIEWENGFNKVIFLKVFFPHSFSSVLAFLVFYLLFSEFDNKRVVPNDCRNISSDHLIK